MCLLFFVLFKSMEPGLFIASTYDSARFKPFYGMDMENVSPWLSPDLLKLTGFCLHEHAIVMEKKE